MGKTTQRSLNEKIVSKREWEISNEKGESWNRYEIWRSKLKLKQIEREDREGTWEEEGRESEGTKGGGRSGYDAGARWTRRWV